MGAGHVIVMLTFGLLISSLQEEREMSGTSEERRRSHWQEVTQQEWCLFISLF